MTEPALGPFVIARRLGGKLHFLHHGHAWTASFAKAKLWTSYALADAAKTKFASGDPPAQIFKVIPNLGAKP